jgi:hypothetical protein
MSNWMKNIENIQVQDNFGVESNENSSFVYGQ